MGLSPQGDQVRYFFDRINRIDRIFEECVQGEYSRS
jgi:hypothetical protein